MSDALLRRLTIAAIVLGVGLRMGAALGPLEPVEKDALQYWTLAHALLERGELGFVPGELTAARTPGYPAFLVGVMTLFGPSVRAIVVLQAVLASLALVVLLAALRRLRVPALGCLLAVSAVAFYRPQLQTIDLLNTEAVILPAMIVTLWLWATYLERPTVLGALAIGLVSAALAYVRPVALFFVPVLWLGALPVRAVRRRWWRDAAIGIGSCTLLVAPWIVRNAVDGFGPRFETFSAFSRYMDVIALEPDFRPGQSPLENYPETRRLAEAVLRAYAGRPVKFSETFPMDRGELSELDIFLALSNRTRQLVVEKPLAWVEMLPCRFLVLWMDVCGETHPNRLYVLTIAHALVLLVIVTAVLLRHRRVDPLPWLAFLTFGYYTALHLAVHVHGRYVWPAMMIMIPAAAVVVADWVRPLMPTPRRAAPSPDARR